jgi:dienelactone hydrolase
LDANDALTLNAPHILLASPGEPADIVAEYKKILSQPGKIGEVETYDTMFHGWMGARANLKDEANLSEYRRGYQQVAQFFARYI